MRATNLVSDYCIYPLTDNIVGVDSTAQIQRLLMSCMMKQRTKRSSVRIYGNDGWM